MTAEERQAYVRRIANAAPPLSREDADLVRALMPLQSRLAAERAVVHGRPQPVHRHAA
ncbi:hypothetical protein AB0N31_10500 [Streptomyces sp. NPDC051051]|uniref:hypothetical protein n=1 Tax=Streptomyces sp. NPDC051051 TaxID=3155666 RepID=UPI00341BADC8